MRIEMTLNYPEEFNTIPVPRNSKIPIIDWKIYQKKRYDKPILENNGNKAVICGKISNNLLVLDLDLKDKKYFKDILVELKKNSSQVLDLLGKTKIVETPHGYHFYYYMKDFSVNRSKNDNAKYNKKLKFTGSLKTHFKYYLKGFDILGNNGYAITWNSRINGLEYKIAKDNPIKHITNVEFNQIKRCFLLEKPRRMRRPFYDILNGKIEIEEQASNAGNEEFLYWKALYREVYHYLGLEPQELYKGLEANQPSFDIEKTKTQLQYHNYRDKPFTNEKLAEMFPRYTFGKPEKEELKLIISKQKTKELTQEQKKTAEKWFNLDEKQRYKDINEIINFYIVGEKERNNAHLIFFLKLGDLLSKDLMNRINFHGDPSAGKSYVCDTVINHLLPEDYILILDGGSPKSFRYSTENRKIVYLREMRRNMSLIEDLKSLGDDDPIWQYVDFQQKDTITVKKDKAGQLTTYSFEYTQRDHSDRSWDIIPDQSYEQNERVKKFKLKCRREKIERAIREKILQQKSQFIKNAIRYLMSKDPVNVINPYANKLEPLFSKKNLRVRRDIDKLLDLIEIITLFNQNNRDIIEFDNEKYIISEFNDLHKALEIGKNFFAKMSVNLDQTKQDILDFMEFTETITKEKQNQLTRKKEVVREERPKKYTLKEIHEYITKEKSQHENTTRNKLKGLVSDGYISAKEEKGKPTFYTKKKDYEKLDLNINDIKEEIIDIIELYKINWKSKVEEVLYDDQNIL